MILINQILNLFDINLNQEFYAFGGMGTTHLCRISEKGLHEKVDNGWVLNNDILAELIVDDNVPASPGLHITV